jgi:hypothetical protein
MACSRRSVQGFGLGASLLPQKQLNAGLMDLGLLQIFNLLAIGV